MIEKDRNVIHVKLNTSLEQTIAKEIEDGMSKIYEKRQEIDFDRQVQRNKDYYDGIIDPNKWGPWEGSAKYFMQMIGTHVDIIAIKGLRQSVGVHPVIQMDAGDEFEDPNALTDREDRLDDVLLKELKLDKLLKGGVYREAATQGASFVKICHTKIEENATYNMSYAPEDIEQYRIDAVEKHKHDEETIFNNLNQLQSGENVLVKVSEKRIVYYGPKAYRVPIENLYARPDIKELERQRLVAEKLFYTWKDIQERIDTGYFREEAIAQIRGENEDYFMKDYELYECILYAKLDDKFRRYVITYEPDSKAILRAIHYPYEHGKIYYIPYYIKERDDSLYGYSIVDMLADSNDYINDLLNSLLDRSSLDNNPVLRVPAKAKLGAYKWGPNSWIPADESIDVLSAQNRTVDDARLIGIMKSFAETIDGVSADILSGGTSTLDPTGPAVKDAMQKNESNFRIEDYIISLQTGNELLAEQVEALKKQYPYKIENNQIVQVQLQQIDNVPVRYIAHGTMLSINKSMQLALIKDYIMLIANLAPEVLKQPDWRRRI